MSMAAHVGLWQGTPVELRRIRLEGCGSSVALLRVDGAPCDEATTIVTAGLGDLVEHRLHEELVVACWSDGPVDDLTLVVEFLVRQLAEGREPLYGDVIGPAGPIVPGTAMEAVYVCEPTYFPPGFAHFVSSKGCDIRTRWLVPIYAAEAHAVGSKGAGFFEDLLVERDPDLLSLHRPSVLSG